MFIIKILLSAVTGIFGAVVGFATFLLKHVLLAISIIALVGVLFVVVNLFVNPITLIRPKRPLSFDVPSEDGGRFLSSSMIGSNYALFFTGSSCKKCLAQIDNIRNIKEDIGVPVYVVFREGNEVIGQTTTLYKRAATRIVVDPTGVLNANAYAFVVPHLSLVNDRGLIVFDVTGNISPKDMERFRKKVDSLA